MLQMNTALRRTAALDESKEELRQIIKSESFLTGEFTLASGQRSSYFLDMKKTMFHPRGAALASDLLFEIVKNEDVDYIGGLEIGAIPIVASICARSWPERPLKAFFVRKALKEHGTNRLIDGQFAPDSRVAIFEDVTTTGGSVMKAVDAVREQGCSVRKILTIVDRLEGATDNLKKEGLELIPLFTIQELLD
jgi:orotate phosphoribosyltransferase